MFRGDPVETVHCKYWKENWTVPRGRPGRMWINDIKHWMKLKTNEEMKRTAQDRCQWRYRTAAGRPSDEEDDR